jgi:hypothetical protein
MALDDRERNFEKALSRQLRGNAAEGLECPDSETLAAYHERMFSPEEMVAQKSHIAACPSCQEILANLEITEAIPAGAEDSERVFAKSARVALSAAHAAPVFSSPAEMAVPATKSSAVKEMPKPKSYMRWAVPAGAIAAGLLVWVAMNNSWRAHKTAQPAAVEIAENREQKDQALTVQKSADQIAAPASKAPEKTLSAENERMNQNLDDAEAYSGAKTAGRMRTNSANAFPHGPALQQNQIQSQIQNNANQSADLYLYKNQVQTLPRAAPAPANAPKRAEKNSKITAAQAPAPPAGTGTGVGAGNSTGDADARKDEKIGSVTETVEVTGAAPALEENKADGVRVSREAAAKPESDAKTKQKGQEAAGAAAAEFGIAAKEKKAGDAGQAQQQLDSVQVVGGTTLALLRDANGSEVQLIRTPNPKIFWIVAKDGEVFRSEDQWKTTRKQEIGAGVKAIAGSATGTKICWLLAENGIALRTKDGGKRWTTVNIPSVAVFTSITALDGLHAIISDASGQVSYSTSDGGASWNLMSKP